MNKRVCLLSLGLLGLTTVASAASAVVFTDEDGVTATKEPAYAYTFSYGSGADVDSTNVNGAKALKFTAPTTTNGESGAGYGFAWSQSCTTAGKCTDGVVSLSTYKGVCLVYSADAKFRMDFKQSTISDDNYYGYELPASAATKKVFVAFSDLKQGWNSGTTVAWNAAKQVGVQFSYKDTYAKAAKLSTNSVILNSFTLGDECVTNAPNVTEYFSGYNGGTITLAEGAIHTMEMPEVFEDADGDSLVITVKIESETKSVVLVDSTAYDQSSTIQFTTASNPQGSATVTLTATDPTKKTATFTFTINTEDVANAPVAKDLAIEIAEDSSYTSPLSKRLSTLGSDIDGDEIDLVIVSQPAHGTLEVKSSTVFTYTPEADYFGEDTFTYKFVETENSESVSNIGTCTITVTPVNDAPEVSFSGETFVDADDVEFSYGDTLTVDEDFSDFAISVATTDISVTDPDGDEDIVVTAKSSGIVNASLEESAGLYVINLSSIKDANGVAKISLAAGDHKITKSVVLCYVKVNPVIDAPTVKDDTYTIPQDSLFKVVAKKGVLANDVNPDSVTLTAVLSAEAEHGTVTLSEDGSFTYESQEGYEGEDYFGYSIAYGESDTTKMAVVTINVVYKNKAPTIVEGVLDTVGTKLSELTEDFTTAKRYTKAEVLTWFTDDQNEASELTYTVRSDDSLLAPSIATTGIITIKAVKNACGDAEVIVTATDKDGASTDLKIPASITCVNDKPETISDTLYVNSDSAWSLVIDLTKFITDPDGDELTYTPNYNKTGLSGELDGNTLMVYAAEDTKYEMGSIFWIGVKAADATTYATANIAIIIGEEPSDAISPVIAAPKASWKNAITASKGMAAIFDMQGRVMWKQALPVSEMEVRGAAASVQGRKILRVNQQTWTIK